MATHPPSCAPYNPQYPNAFGYQPSLAPGITFTILFLLSAVGHLFQAVRYRTAWQGLFVVGAGCETLGWIARIAARYCAYSRSMFTMQISLLIFAPAWTTAGLYILLLRLIPLLPAHTSPLPPKPSLLICLGIDILSLALQATGGGLAGSAFASNSNTNPGVYTMVAGVLVQLASTLIYSVFMLLIFFRARGRIGGSKSLRRLGGVVVGAVVALVGRNVYRCVELLEGWRGMLNSQERWVVGLDGVLMVFALLLLNVFNPGRLLGNAGREGGEARGDRGREKVGNLEESDGV